MCIYIRGKRHTKLGIRAICHGGGADLKENLSLAGTFSHSLSLSLYVYARIQWCTANTIASRYNEILSKKCCTESCNHHKAIECGTRHIHMITSFGGLNGKMLGKNKLFVTLAKLEFC